MAELQTDQRRGCCAEEEGEEVASSCENMYHGTAHANPIGKQALACMAKVRCLDSDPTPHRIPCHARQLVLMLDRIISAPLRREIAFTQMLRPPTSLCALERAQVFRPLRSMTKPHIDTCQAPRKCHLASLRMLIQAEQPYSTRSDGLQPRRPHRTRTVTICTPRKCTRCSAEMTMAYWITLIMHQKQQADH